MEYVAHEPKLQRESFSLPIRSVMRSFAWNLLPKWCLAIVVSEKAFIPSDRNFYCF